MAPSRPHRDQATLAGFIDQAMGRTWKAPLASARVGAMAVLLCIAFALPASSQSPLSPDPLVNDAVSIFANACLKTFGNRDKVSAKMAEIAASKLSDDDATQLAHGVKGSLAWSYPTPHGARTAVSWSPPGLCAVLIQKVDATAMQVGVRELLNAATQGNGFEYRLKNHETRSIPGGSQEMSAYLLHMPRGEVASIVVSGTSSAEAQLQGFVTFTFVNDKYQ